MLRCYAPVIARHARLYEWYVFLIHQNVAFDLNGTTWLYAKCGVWYGYMLHILVYWPARTQVLFAVTTEDSTIAIKPCWAMGSTNKQKYLGTDQMIRVCSGGGLWFFPPCANTFAPNQKQTFSSSQAKEGRNSPPPPNNPIFLRLLWTNFLFFTVCWTNYCFHHFLLNDFFPKKKIPSPPPPRIIWSVP